MTGTEIGSSLCCGRLSTPGNSGIIWERRPGHNDAPDEVPGHEASTRAGLRSIHREETRRGPDTGPRNDEKEADP